MVFVEPVVESATLIRISRWRMVAANIFFCATLFPFVSPFPIQTDTQPVALILALTILIGSSIKGQKFTRSELLILLFPTLSLIYINPLASNFSPDNVGKYFALLAGSIVYVAARRSFYLFSVKTFYISILFYFIFTFLLMLWPDTFFNIQSLFVRAINTAGEDNPFSYRGIPTLSTEPGLFGGVLIFQLFLLDYFGRSHQLSVTQYWLVFAMIFFMVVSTKSGTGYLYFFIYTIYLILRGRNGLIKVAIGLFGFFSAMTISIELLDSSSDLGRGFQIIYGLLLEPDVLMNDTSTIGRLYDFFLGFLSLLEYPFGSGVNGVNEATFLLSAEYTFLRNYYGISVIGLVSGLAWSFTAYGIFAFIYFIYIYITSTKAPIGARLFSFLLLSFSYSTAFPGIWVLLALPPLRRTMLRNL